MRLGEFTFRPGWALTLIAVALMVLFVRLGFWQLDRARQAEDLNAMIDNRAHLPVVELTAAAEPLPDLRFREIHVIGHFAPDKQILLDNQMHEGRTGLRVITPLKVKVANAQPYVLVDRGWVALGSSREHLPQPEVPTGEVTVRGIADIPSEPSFVLSYFSQPGPAWGRLWPYLDLAYFEQLSGSSVLPFLIHDDAGDAQGLVRAWQAPERKPAMHLGYALQWFGFAVVALAIYIGLALSRSGIRNAVQAA